MSKFKISLLVTGVFLLNFIIYLRAFYTIEPVEGVFAECARNSGRTAAAINLIILFFLGYFGMKSIYKKKKSFYLFRNLVLLFAVNHIIHLFFVFQNFSVQHETLGVLDNLHGTITVAGLVIAPVVLFLSNRLRPLLHWFFMVHILNTTYFIAISFYARYKPVDPAYLHRIGILIMGIAAIFVIYRFFEQRKQEYLIKPS